MRPVPARSLGRAWRKILFRGIAVLLAAFVAAEIGLRARDSVLGRGWNSPMRRMVYDGSLYAVPRIFCQFRHRPGARFLIPGSDPPAEVWINSLGLRGDEVSRQKPAGVYRILCLGGSTTFDAFNGTALHWPLLLEKKLEEQFPGRDFEVLNAGVNSWSTAHSLAYLLFDGLALQPDLVIVYHNVNDIAVNFHGDPEPDYSNRYGHPSWDPRPEGRLRPLDLLLDWSQTYLWLGLFAKEHLAPPPKLPGLYDAARGTPAARYYRRNLESIHAAAAAQGIKVVYGLQAQDIVKRYDSTVQRGLTRLGAHAIPDAATYAKFHGEYVRITREVAEAHGAAVADVDVELSGRTEMFVDFCHTTLEGTRIVAEVFKKAVAPLVEPAPGSARKR